MPVRLVLRALDRHDHRAARRRAATRLGIVGNDGYRLWLDGTSLIDDWQQAIGGDARSRHVDLRAGVRHAIRLEYFERPAMRAWRSSGMQACTDRWRRDIDSAVAVARQRKSPSSSRASKKANSATAPSSGLPGHQEAADQRRRRHRHAGGRRAGRRQRDHHAELARSRRRQCSTCGIPAKQAATRSPTSLFGDADPGGRLPVTFPLSEGQLPLVLRPRADRPRRRLRRPHRPAAVPVRVRTVLHVVRVLRARDHARHDRRRRRGAVHLSHDEHRRA